MHKRPVAIIADHDLHATYTAMLEAEERIALYPFEPGGDYTMNHGMDLLILDCGTDADAGLNHLRIIKQRYPQVPVFFITAALAEEHGNRAYKAGAREYFTVPVDVAEFKAIKASVTKILQLKRETSESRVSLTAAKTEELVSGIPVVKSDVPERILRAIHHIEQNLSTPLYLEKIAQIAFLSKYHFCRMFKKHLGLSPIQFIHNLRIYRATILLRCTDLAISTVACRTGFNALSEFNKQFKKVHGVPPSEFRKSRKAPESPLA